MFKKSKICDFNEFRLERDFVNNLDRIKRGFYKKSKEFSKSQGETYPMEE